MGSGSLRPRLRRHWARSGEMRSSLARNSARAGCAGAINQRYFIGEVNWEACYRRRGSGRKTVQRRAGRFAGKDLSSSLQPVPSRPMTKTFAELKFPGRLVAVEGLDGSGKSTQIYLLKRWLEVQGIKVFFSEWNSSELVKAATSKGKKRELLTPTTFCLIHATDFADRYERQLVPLLRAGYIVLCDRYIFTAYARDVVRGCRPEWVRGIYDFAALPDLTFFFKADLEISLQRILDGRPQLKYFEAGMDLRLSEDSYESFRIFQGRILEQYLAMAPEFNFITLDANQAIEAQQSVVREILGSRLKLSDFTANYAILRPQPSLKPLAAAH